MRQMSLAILISLCLTGCFRESSQKHEMVFYDLCLANKTDKDVYGSYVLDNGFKGTDGVISSWGGKTEGFMPTNPNTKITVTFKDDLDSIIASETFEPMKYFPRNLDKSITTTYTLFPDSKIQLSFEVHLGGGNTKTIIPGESDSDKQRRERDDELVNAARDGDISKVTRLLAEGANINARNSFGMSPIMMAVMGKHHAIVKLLMTKNPDLTFTNGNGKSVYDIAQQDEILRHILPKK
ncbi:ankyrin repeat domain-containing protein [Geotalea sp. SG265]|uniref:ankyrin repeat domain-containing protein n=1 Tax=Geotalea sp. SG265 TaxID=2922867 RepID=UPI001FB027E0|nr:ankyrin repeat domain-containing protein [Geotalea sp. SG265]